MNAVCRKCKHGLKCALYNDSNKNPKCYIEILHPTKLKGYKDFEKLTDDLSRLRYDKLAEFLELLSEKLQTDSINDYDANKLRLSSALQNASCYVYEAFNYIKEAWKICEKYFFNNNKE